MKLIREQGLQFQNEGYFQKNTPFIKWFLLRYVSVYGLKKQFSKRRGLYWVQCFIGSGFLKDLIGCLQIVQQKKVKIYSFLPKPAKKLIKIFFEDPTGSFRWGPTHRMDQTRPDPTRPNCYWRSDQRYFLTLLNQALVCVCFIVPSLVKFKTTGFFIRVLC